MKIPRLDLQRIDEKVSVEHVARTRHLLRLISWIRHATMSKLIAAAGWQLEFLIAIGKTNEVA
ncbi:hypothetical protein K6301_24290 (plasmid) [Shinella oryzae]|nr:hypothetical protein K6301_24290 [Shinella oryzae]